MTPLLLLTIAQPVVEAYYKPLIERGTVTAAAYAEVSRGEIVETANFGRADAQSLWRGASTSKAFTAIAVMRLVQQGRVDLDASVDQYLKRFKIRVTRSGKPVTSRSLLAHTSGLDDPFVNSCFLNGEVRFVPPELVHEPGDTKLYSNAGYGVIGTVIEDVTGQRFEDFMRANVFEPLGMTSSTFQQPLPAAMAARVVPTVERSVFGRAGPAPILYHHSTEAGGLTSSLADRTRFAQHIQKGGYEELQRVLGEDSAGFGFGTNRGQKYRYAGGDLGGYHTVILWFPEHDRALVTMAASASNLATWNLVPKVMESWFGADTAKPPIAPAAHAQAREFAARVAGLYRPVRYPHRDLAKTFIVTMDQKVRDNGDGSIQQGGERWVATESLRFANDAGRSITFQQDSTSGNIRFLNRESERIEWYESGVAAISFYTGFILLSAVVAFRSKGWMRVLSLSILVHSLAWLGCVLIADPQRLIVGIPWYLQGVLWSGWLILPLVVAAAIRAWKSLPITCALCLYVPFCLYWNILPMG